MRRSPARSRARRTTPERNTSTCSIPTSTCGARTSNWPATKLLDYSPPWLVQRLHELGEIGGALCSITGNPEPELFADLDGARVGKARMHALAEESLKLTDGLCNWTIVAYPNEGWARTVFGEPDVERLWEAVGHAVRLDEADPVAAWREHIAHLQERAAALNERRFDGAPLPRPRHRPDDRAASRRATGRRRSTNRTGSSTSRTCRRKRSSRLRTPVASRARFARRCRSRSRGTSCGASRCASSAAARSRCVPRRART